MTVHDFHIAFKEYKTMLKAMPTKGLVQLVKSHILYNQTDTKASLLLDCIIISKHICQMF